VELFSSEVHVLATSHGKRRLGRELIWHYSCSYMAQKWGVYAMPSQFSEAQKIEVLLSSSDAFQTQLLTKELKRYRFCSLESCGGGLEDCRQALLRSAVEVLLLVESLECPSRLMLGWLPELLRKYPELRVILVHGSSNKELTVEAVVAGVRGLFSQEQQTIEAMAKCIQRVRQGELWLNSTEILHLTDALSKRRMPRCRTRPTRPLTVRQLGMAQLVAEGMGNREIALQLGVTENTVKKHLTKIFEKLGVSSRVELVLSTLQAA
jgi:two-component system nitrate/nitrite response regulator NarL